MLLKGGLIPGEPGRPLSYAADFGLFLAAEGSEPMLVDVVGFGRLSQPFGDQCASFCCFVRTQVVFSDGESRCAPRQGVETVFLNVVSR